MSTLHDELPLAGPGRPATGTGRLAEINSVPKKEAGQVLTSSNISIATGLTLLPIGTGLVGGFGGLGLALYFSSTNPPIAGLCAVLGVLCGVLSVVVLLSYQQFLPSRYLRWVARRAFALRGSPLVRCDDPQAEFVDIVPRSNWGRTMAEPATDTGFWRINEAARELLFEGDHKRYRIPFDAVTSCEVEEIRMDSDQWGNDLYFATVLAVETANGEREIPLCGRQLEFAKRRMPQRRAQAESFCERIVAAMGAGNGSR